MALILMPMGLLVSVPAGGSPEEIFEHTLAPLIGGERQGFQAAFPGAPAGRKAGLRARLPTQICPHEVGIRRSMWH